MFLILLKYHFIPVKPLFCRIFILTVTNIIYFSLTSDQFHPILKESVISPLLKKSTLDKDELSNYRLISNLSVISKIIERVVKFRLIDHLTSSKLLNPHQSAYCKHHSTETALLYIHDHLINATGSQKVSCLCLLDLSAAFDTIDHNILITRLSSWFGINGSVLSWFKSYLSFRSFRVKCGIPQGSVLYSSSCTLHSQYSVLFHFPRPPPLCT